VQKINHNGKMLITYQKFEELKSNVTWPEWSEVQRLTIVVAVFLYYSGNWIDEFFCKSFMDFFNWIKACYGR
jgi:preprotein translocase subunit SecE